MTASRLLRHVEACNRFDPAAFCPFFVGGDPVGAVRLETAAHLTGKHLAAPHGAGVGIAGAGFRALSATLAKIVDSLSTAGLMATPRGESMPVYRGWGAAPIAEIDRSGLPALGIPAYGVHVNGVVRNDAGLHLWIGHRAKDRPVAPGKLDHLVAGGLPMGLTLMETVVKEGQEEAGLSADIAGRAKPVGLVSYRLALPEGLRADTLFVYDLEVPPEVVPANTDGEVERFELWPVARVAAALRDTDDFKFNVNLVLIDFLIRHGVLNPDNEPNYTALVMGLRQ